MLGGRVLDIDGAMTASRSSPRIMLGVPQVEPGTDVEVETPKEGTEINSGPLPKNELKDATGVSMGTVPAHDLKSRNEAELGTVPDNDAKDAHDVALARAKETSGTDPLDGEGGSLGNFDRETQGLLPDGGGPGQLEKGDEDKQLAEVERKLNERIEGDAVLRSYRSNITVERTVEGIRVQILDDDKREMFPLGSAEMLDHTNKLFKMVADLVKDQPNRIAISGHTDATPYRGSGGYSNWELSTDRANASRRALMAAGVPESRIARVVGKADTEPMDAAQPEGAINRRISIVLLREGRPGITSAARRSGALTPASLQVPSRPDAGASTTAASSAAAPLPTPATPPSPPVPVAAETAPPPASESEKRAALPWPEPAKRLEPVRAGGSGSVAEPETPVETDSETEAEQLRSKPRNSTAKSICRTTGSDCAEPPMKVSLAIKPEFSARRTDRPAATLRGPRDR